MSKTRKPGGGKASRPAQEDGRRVRRGNPYRPLTQAQSEVLRLLQSKAWTGQWIWRNHSTTRRVLESLVGRGLVQRRSRARKPSEPIYQISPMGEAMLQRTEKRGLIFLEIPSDRAMLVQCCDLDVVPSTYAKIPSGAAYITHQPWRMNLRGELEERVSAWSVRIKPSAQQRADGFAPRELGSYKTPQRALLGLLLYLSSQAEQESAAPHANPQVEPDSQS